MVRPLRYQATGPRAETEGRQQVAEIQPVWRVHYLDGKRWRKSPPISDLKQAAAQAREIRAEGVPVYIKGR